MCICVVEVVRLWTSIDCSCPQLERFASVVYRGNFVRSVGMLLPHEMFAAIYEFYPAMWKKFVCPSVDSIRAFWEAVRGSEQYESHEVKHRAGHQSAAIPIRMHGDGTPISGAPCKVYCMSIVSMSRIVNRCKPDIVRRSHTCNRHQMYTVVVMSWTMLIVVFYIML